MTRTRTAAAVAACLSAAVSSAGCDDASVRISLSVPAAYRSLINSVIVEILVPPSSSPFTCEQVAFGDVPADTLSASLVQGVALRGEGSRDIAGIPRFGDKLVLARGFDAQDVPIVAACQPLGDIEDDVEVYLLGEPTTVVDVPDVGFGAQLPPRLQIDVADANGDAVPATDVRWTVTGPGNEVFVGTARTGPNGSVDIDPQPPQRPGPVALDIDVRWARTPSESIIGFRQPPTWLSVALDDPALDTTSPTESIYQVGRLGPAGEPGLAVLTAVPETGGARAVRLWYFDETAGEPPFRSVTSPPFIGASAIGRVTRGGRDIVMSMTPSSWIEVDPSTGDLVPAATPAPGRVAVRILSIGGCVGRDASERILVLFDDGTATAFDANRNAITSPFSTNPPSERLVATGCVSGVGGDVYRAAVFTEIGQRQVIVADMGERRSGTWTSVTTGIGFAPARGTNPALLLGVDVDIGGTAIVRYRLVPIGANELDVEEVTRDDAATLSLSTSGGDLDGDGETDVVGLLFFGDVEDRSAYRVHVALGVEHRGERLVGVSAEQSTPVPRLWIRDFDEDGVDDIVVGGPAGFAVLRMGSNR